MPSIDPRLRQIQKRTRHRERRHEQPRRGEKPPLERLERPVTVPDRGDRHNRQVNRVNEIELLDEMQNQRTDPDTQNDDAQRQKHFHPYPHPPFLEIDYIVFSREPMVMPSSRGGAHLYSGEDHAFLEIKNVVDDATKQDIEEAEAEQDEDDSEELGPGSQRSDVSVADRAHSDDAEVERVDDGVGFDSRVVVSVEGVD